MILVPIESAYVNSY